MDIKPVSNRMYALIVLHDMHTTFYPKALDGISDKDAQRRLDTKANHIAWLAGSLVQERYELVNELGKTDLKQQAHELFKDHQGIKDDVVYPSLDQLKKDWDAISPKLREILINVNEEQLDKMLDIPEMKMPYYDLISFMTYREANCIGQIALWRRLLGYEGMKYM